MAIVRSLSGKISGSLRVMRDEVILDKRGVNLEEGNRTKVKLYVSKMGLTMTENRSICQNQFSKCMPRGQFSWCIFVIAACWQTPTLEYAREVVIFFFFATLHHVYL